MRLFLVRHGETSWNRAQRCQGASDVPLSATGRAQAAGLAAALAAEPLVAVYASPLVRALETARAVAAPRGLPVTAHPGLRELHHGACEGLTPVELRARFAPLLAAWRAAPGDVRLPGGGESMREVQARAFAALLEVAGRHGPEDAVAVVSHNLAILACLARVLGWPLDRFRELRQDVGAVSVLDLEPGGVARPVSLNETAHLGYLARRLPPQDAGPPAHAEDGTPRLYGDLDAPFTFLAARALAARGALRLAWRGVRGDAVACERAQRAAGRLAAATGVSLVAPPPLADAGPALRLLAEAEALRGAGLRLAVRLGALRFVDGRDLSDPRLLLEAAAAEGLPRDRAAASLDPATAVGAAAAARVAADEAEAARARVGGLPAAVHGPRVRTGAALLALGARLLRASTRAVPVATALLVALAAATGCGRQGLFAGFFPKPRASVAASDALAETRISRVAVLDFVAPAGTEADARFLADEVRAALRARQPLSVAADTDVAAALEAARVPAPADGWPPLGLVRAVAREVGADAVVTGRITRFREREGTALATRVPASVEFVIEVRRGEDGILLWRGEYDETQEALSENLADAGTFFRGGARWLTARELARLGVADLLARAPLPHAPAAEAPPG